MKLWQTFDPDGRAIGNPKEDQAGAVFWARWVASGGCGSEFRRLTWRALRRQGWRVKKVEA